MARGHRVQIIAANFDYLSRRAIPLAPGKAWQHEVVDGVGFRWLRTPSYRDNTLARLWSMLAFAAQVWLETGLRDLERPDVIVGSSPHLFAAWAAQRLAARRRVPFVLEVRDLWPQTLVDLGQVSPRHPLVLTMLGIERYLYRQARRIVSLLPGAVEHLAAKGADPGKVVWIPNGVDLAAVPAPAAPDPGSAPPGAGPPAPATAGAPFTVIYAGAHGLANHLDVILDAARLLQQQVGHEAIRFRLIGDGPEKPRLQQRARDEGIENVRFEPPVPKHSVYAAIQAAQACVVTLKESPLYRWGFSLNKLFDYLACGRPVVIGVRSPYNPVAEAGAGLTVAPEDPPALAAAVRQLAALPPAERANMGRQGRAYVESRHAVETMADRLEALLRACAQEGAGKRRG